MTEYLAVGDVTASPHGGPRGYSLGPLTNLWSPAGAPPWDSYNSTAEAVVVNHKIYMAGKDGKLWIYDVVTGANSSVALTSGTAFMVCAWLGIVYIMTNSNPGPLYSYNPATSTLTTLRASVIGGGSAGTGNTMQCDGISVWTDNGAGKVYRTVISTGATTTYSIPSSNQTQAMLLDPTGTYLFFSQGTGSFGGSGYVICINASTMALVTSFGFVNGVSALVNDLWFDVNGYLWACGAANIQYWTTPTTFTGGVGKAITGGGGLALKTDATGANLYVVTSGLGIARILKFDVATLTQTALLTNTATGSFLPSPRAFLVYDNIVATTNGNFFAFMGM